MKPGKGRATSAMGNGMTHIRHPSPHPALPTTDKKRNITGQSNRTQQREPFAVDARPIENLRFATVLAVTPPRPWATTTHRGQIFKRRCEHTQTVTAMGEKPRPPFPGHEQSERPRAGRGTAGVVPKQNSQSGIEEPHEMTVGRIPIKRETGGSITAATCPLLT